jgi:hypothetical protein
VGSPVVAPDIAAGFCLRGDNPSKHFNHWNKISAASNKMTSPQKDKKRQFSDHLTRIS